MSYLACPNMMSWWCQVYVKFILYVLQIDLSSTVARNILEWLSTFRNCKHHFLLNSWNSSRIIFYPSRHNLCIMLTICCYYIIMKLLEHPSNKSILANCCICMLLWFVLRVSLFNSSIILQSVSNYFNKTQ